MTQAVTLDPAWLRLALTRRPDPPATVTARNAGAGDRCTVAENSESAESGLNSEAQCPGQSDSAAIRRRAVTPAATTCELKFK